MCAVVIPGLAGGSKRKGLLCSSTSVLAFLPGSFLKRTLPVGLLLAPAQVVFIAFCFFPMI